MPKKYNDSNRPPKGTKFIVTKFKGGDPDFLNDEADQLVGQIGEVTGHVKWVGVEASVGKEKSLIPYDQCQW